MNIQLSSFQKTAHILLVEDHLVNSLVATNMLKKLGCTVEVVTNGYRAVEVCEQHRYDLILMDIQMPAMGGVEATRLILQGASRDTPIIAMTANNNDAEIESYLAAGMKDCVSKPIILEQLRFIVEKYTGFLILPPQHGKTESETEDEEYVKQTKKTTAPQNDKSMVRESQPAAWEKLPIFDFEQAKRISIGNQDMLEKILNKFNQDMPKQFEKLKMAIQAANQIEIQRIAHSIKGSAQSIGAFRLGEVAMKAENLAKIGHLQKITDLVETLQEEFKQLQANLQRD
jgi:CheY-like chemotaxis protein